jgi:hypothetical protein
LCVNYLATRHLQVVPGNFSIPPCRLLTVFRRIAMTLCPIAVVAGCQKCPAFSLCPLKSVLGDQDKSSQSKPASKKPGKKT